MKILVIRHGYSVGNQMNVFCGKTEVPLTELGVEQGKLVSEYVYKNYKIDGIYASALERAKKTVERLSELTGIKTIAYEEFNEKSFGRWEGKGFKEIKEKYPEEYEWFVADPMRFKPVDGEDYSDLIKRVKRGLDKIYAKHKENNQTVALATHGGVIRALEIMACNMGMKAFDIKLQQNGTISIMEYDGENLKILERGISSYLGDKETDGVVKL